jgi:hypothetical protein
MATLPPRDDWFEQRPERSADFGQRLGNEGAPMGVIAPQLGHSDTRMTEKHYAHLAPSYIADRVRAALPGFGILAETNIAAFGSRP